MVNAFALSPRSCGNTAGSGSTESLSHSVSRVAALCPADRRVAAEAQYRQLLNQEMTVLRRWRPLPCCASCAARIAKVR